MWAALCASSLMRALTPQASHLLPVLQVKRFAPPRGRGTQNYTIIYAGMTSAVAKEIYLVKVAACVRQPICKNPDMLTCTWICVSKLISVLRGLPRVASSMAR